MAKDTWAMPGMMPVANIAPASRVVDAPVAVAAPMVVVGVTGKQRSPDIAQEITGSGRKTFDISVLAAAVLEAKLKILRAHA